MGHWEGTLRQKGTFWRVYEIQLARERSAHTATRLSVMDGSEKSHTEHLKQKNVKFLNSVVKIINP